MALAAVQHAKPVSYLATGHILACMRALGCSIFMGLILTPFLVALGGCSTGQRIDLPEQTIFLDVHGQPFEPLTCAAQATALIFITNDCPIANSYAPEINHIVREYEPRGVTFFLVHVDAALPAEDARRHAEDFGYRCAVLLDPHLHLARAVHASKTPEAAVINHDRRLVYLGRIDDRYIDFGKKRFAPTQRNLRSALDAALAGRSVASPRVPAVGCDIPNLP